MARATLWLSLMGLFRESLVLGSQLQRSGKIHRQTQSSPGRSARTSLRGAGASESKAPSDNPLLSASDLPLFGLVQPEHAVPAVEARLAEGLARLRTLEASVAKVLAKSSASDGYEMLVLPLEDMYESMDQPWQMLNHLQMVRDSPELRSIMEDLRPRVVEFWQNLSQSRSVYHALGHIRNASDYASLPEARRRIVEGELLSRKLGGVALSGNAAEEFNSVAKQLSNLSTQYGHHVQDAKKAWKRTLTAKEHVAGVPRRALEAAAAAAKLAGRDDATADAGPWVLTLDGPVLGPVLTYARNRSLREELMRASASLASSGPNSNAETLSRILELRQRKAELLGYTDFAALSFADKMATRSEVHRLLDQLKAVAKPAAEADERALAKFARQSDGLEQVQPWDRAFYVERQRQKLHGIDAEKLREYFPYPTVAQGLFDLCNRLFAVTIRPLNRDDPRIEASIWHPDVQVYEVVRGGSVAGHILIDPYSRPAEKRNGAWVMGLTKRRATGSSVRLPVAALITNFPPPPASGGPSLLSLGEVGTLFHEFGHALQNVLTLQNETAVAGISGIEWDAVEVVSQFMEYWPDHDRGTLLSFARHHATGEPLPEEMYQNLRGAHSFRAGPALISQIFLGKVDLTLHEHFQPGENTNAIVDSVAKEVLVVPLLPEARPLCTFNHIFAGGYPAAYYSYQWSKVLSADAFGAFDDAGALADPARARAVGARFAATLLARGGGQDPAAVFADFRGRAPRPEALLRYSGLAMGASATDSAARRSE